MTEVLHAIADMKRVAAGWRAAGQRIGLVPTMGALHEAHLGLMRAARQGADRVVSSIFVNPLQFGPGEDFERYPRQFESDRDKAAEAGVDVIFLASAREMYPPGYQSYVVVEELAAGLCGPFRPGHFRGVATVVLKLFHIVQPHAAWFGEKDYQQLRLIERMVADLDMDVEVVACPLMRAEDGLALSSRNALLSADERAKAPCLYRALQAAAQRLRRGERSATRLAGGIREALLQVDGVTVDYVAVVHPRTLERVSAVDQEVLVAGAIRLGGVRLIDNLRMRP